MGVPLSISMKLSKILWDLEATLINKEGLVQTPGQDGCQATSGRAERVEPGGTGWNLAQQGHPRTGDS